MALTEVVQGIVARNLEVYRTDAHRLQEDVSQEAQVAHDYEGRLVFELLQNADDAMAGMSTPDDRVRFVVDDDGLWVANSGRPLTEFDILGLCGLGASSKVDPRGPRRASIGHKGLGFKSVLEITDRPAVYSTTCSFELGVDHARPLVTALWTELGRGALRDLPAMRLPVSVTSEPAEWIELRGKGFNTAFHFPFRTSIDSTHKRQLAKALLEMTPSTVLFLKHLERVDVDCLLDGTHECRSWTITRSCREGDNWTTRGSMDASGAYRIAVQQDEAEQYVFIVAHDADVPIDGHRAGLTGPAWHGVNLTEISVAALSPDAVAPMPAEWRRFHVFLPTADVCAYPLLVNAAFSTDLSRQRVRVTGEPDDYNSHLVRNAARLIVTRLLDEIAPRGDQAVLHLLDRTTLGLVGSPASDLLHEALSSTLLGVALLPSGPDAKLALDRTVVPTTILGEEGADFRRMLRDDAALHGRRFPVPEFCTAPWASIAVDHGARELSPADTLSALADLNQPDRAQLQDDDLRGFSLDPILELCSTAWREAEPAERAAIELRVRQARLFPVMRGADGSVTRVAIEGTPTFYPPLSTDGELPLTGLHFMCHDVCWGTLTRDKRRDALSARMKVWNTLFDVKEFAFEAVMRAAVTPALAANRDDDAAVLLQRLCNVEVLAAICRLASTFVKPDRPLRYQRFSNDSNLFSLSRLPVPCRGVDGVEVWKPAFSVYFGNDWIGDSSLESVLEAVARIKPECLPSEVYFLAPPERLVDLLPVMPRMGGGVTSEVETQSVDPTVDLDGDTTDPYAADAHARWVAFLAWIGVNRCLRLIHFQDVDEERVGWLTTEGVTKPRGRAFASLGSTWSDYRSDLDPLLDEIDNPEDSRTYLYEAHDLDMAENLIAAAEDDVSMVIGERFLGHLAIHWEELSPFTETQVAVVPHGKWPGSRSSKNALPQEVHAVGDNLWVHRLRRRSFLPTSLGPRRPDQAWLRSSEVDRRFGRSGREAGDLLPLVSVSEGHPTRLLNAACERLGVRPELTPSAFEFEDAHLLCAQLEVVIAQRRPEDVLAVLLRTVVKPTYRQLFELLAGKSRNQGGPALMNTRLMVSDTSGLTFVAGNEVLFTSTPGIRERLGISGSVPTFVLEAEPSAAAPLVSIFGAQNLEKALHWNCQPGEQALVGDVRDEFHRQLRELLPSLVARVLVERDEIRDRIVLRELFALIEPVDSLDLTCEFGGTLISGVSSRPYFVDVEPSGHVKQAFIRWEGGAWPPTPEAAQALAMAMADALGLNLVETFMAFIRSAPEQRSDLLALAGATTLLADAAAALAANETVDRHPLPTIGPTPTLASDRRDHWEEVPLPILPPPPVPLYRIEDLVVDGMSVLVAGRTPQPPREGQHVGHPTSLPDKGSGQGSYGGSGTDLTALDGLGMYVAMASEVNRLVKAGVTDAAILIPGRDVADRRSLVVDVHNPDAIAAAIATSLDAKRCFEELAAANISAEWPGFDILTIRDGQVDRMIELKSSTVDAQIQAMSWNEWKSAGNEHFRSRFWLYLVGNLRSDLPHADPFVRAINDPFGCMQAAERTDTQVRTTLQLRVREFSEAEFTTVKVSGPSQLNPRPGEQDEPT